MPSPNVLAALRARINYAELYGSLDVQLTGRGAERMARCPFHEDSTPSMGINVQTGLFHCHGCAAGGDVFAFVMRVRSLTFPAAVSEVARLMNFDLGESSPASTVRTGAPSQESQEAVLAAYRPPVEDDRIIDERVVAECHDSLMTNAERLAWLGTARGLTEETVREYRLGLYSGRFTIPVLREDGACVNIRRYLPNAARAQDKMRSWREGFGSARLYPIASLTSGESTVYLMEGEMDTLLALQCGLNAITCTGGAGTWSAAWSSRFAGRDVVIVYDCDEAGRTGARRVAEAVVGYASSVKIIDLGLTEPRGADFTDYIHGHQIPLADFHALVARTPHYVAPHEPPPEETRAPVFVHLARASDPEYHNQQVVINAMVSGKRTSPYQVPEEAEAVCGRQMGQHEFCATCAVALAANGGVLRKVIEFERRNEVIEFCDVASDRLTMLLKSKLHIPRKCSYVRTHATRAVNVEEVQVIPEIDYHADGEQPYVTRKAYVMERVPNVDAAPTGERSVQANRSYILTGMTLPDPKNQMAVLVVNHRVPAQSSIDAFRTSAVVTEQLRVFAPRERGLAALTAQVDWIASQLEQVTRIVHRRDLITALDLTYHSVLSFTFQGSRLVRGWCEALVIGDTRTGKSSSAAAIVQHYRAGEVCTGENTSFAGLIGGLDRLGNDFVIRWGRVPLNDRRLLVIDEASSLAPEQIERLSGMRSSGVAEIIKIHTERTQARTRGVWISNPRNRGSLGQYSQGVLAVKDLIGKPEDIARFDLVVTAASHDVALDVVNAARIEGEPLVLTSDLCHQRVMWAWSRKPDQVVWCEDAEQVVLTAAQEQGSRYRYATEIPLVEPNEHRIKLARLAVACAAMVYSTDEHGDIVRVLPEHVAFAVQFLDQLYRKPSLAFDRYAATESRRHTLRDIPELRRIIARNEHAVEQLLSQEFFSQRDLAEVLAIDSRDDLRAGLTTLRTSGFIRRAGGSNYVKTPAAIIWLQDGMPGGGDAAPAATPAPEPPEALPADTSFDASGLVPVPF